MPDYEPASGYNLPPGCFEHDIDAYFGEGKPTCAECKRMVECCCDYGICDFEYKEAFNNEFGNFKAEADSVLPDVAEWALDWIANHMRDMQGIACENFAE